MINLLPHNIKENRKYGRRNRSLLGYSLLLMLTALGTAGIMAGSLSFIGADKPSLQNEINESNIKILSLESTVKETEKIATRLETAKKISDSSVSFSDLIPEIGAVLPDGVILNALSLTGGKIGVLQLDVDMVNSSLAPILIKNLVESDLFEAADIGSLTPKGSGPASNGTDDQVSSYAFSASLTASFTGTNDAKKKIAAAAAAKKAAQEAAAAEGAQ